MEFKKVSIGNYSYGLDCGLDGQIIEEEVVAGPDERDEENQQLLDSECNYSQHSGQKQKKRPISHFNFFDAHFEAHLRDPSHPNHHNIVNFLTHLALCHTIVIQRKAGGGGARNNATEIEQAEDSERSQSEFREVYSAQSPDELALVNAARHFGVKFASRPTKASILID